LKYHKESYKTEISEISEIFDIINKWNKKPVSK
jgi:hypothetical protein